MVTALVIPITYLCLINIMPVSTFSASDKRAQATIDPPWLWNSWAESSEVRNRGYQWPHKWASVQQIILLTHYNHVCSARSFSCRIGSSAGVNTNIIPSSFVYCHGACMSVWVIRHPDAFGWTNHLLVLKPSDFGCWYSGHNSCECSIVIFLDNLGS